MLLKVVLATAASAKGSPFLGKQAAALTMSSGCVHLKGQSPESGVPFQEILRLGNLASANGEGKTGGYGSDTMARTTRAILSGRSSLRLSGTQASPSPRQSCRQRRRCGPHHQRQNRTNQMAGAIVMGIGMGLFETTTYDPRNGHPINDNFADYVVPT